MHLHDMSNTTTYAKAKITGRYFNGRAFEAATTAEALALPADPTAESFLFSWACEVEIEAVPAPVEKFVKVSDSRTGHKSGTERHYQSGNLHLYISSIRHKPTDRFRKAYTITTWRAIRWDEASRKVTAELTGDGGYKVAIAKITGKI
jgi:hypothetical protein